jgi:DNA-binding MarR family transcriptional regulator
MREAHKDWISMSEAARIIGVSTAKISRLAAKGKIETRTNLKDERVKLVSISQLKAYFEESADKSDDD